MTELLIRVCGILASSIGQDGKECYNVIAGLGGQEVTFNDIAGFVRERRTGSPGLELMPDL